MTLHEEARFNYCSGGTLTAMSYPMRNIIRIWCSACGGTGLEKDDVRLADARRRLALVRAKHERTGGPDEQELADMGRTS
jgi:hypothetical protein